MKSLKIFLFILLGFFAFNITVVNADEFIGEITIVVSHTVTFDANGGTGTMVTQEIEEGKTTNLNANNNNFTRSGYTFSGWAESSSGVKVYDNQSFYTMGMEDDTLYAVWTLINYVDLTVTTPITPTSGSVGSPVSFNTTMKNDGNTSVSGNLFSYSLKIIDYQTGGSLYVGAYKYPNILSAGQSDSISYSYTFTEAGRYEAQMCVDYYGDISESNLNGTGENNNCTNQSTIDIKATVSFNANGGIGTMSPQYFSGDPEILNANVFTRADYTFSGWATSASGSVVYGNRENVNILTNTTLYAVWTKVLKPDLTISEINYVSPNTASIGVTTTFSNTIINDADIATPTGFSYFPQVKDGAWNITDLPAILTPAFSARESRVVTFNYTFIDQEEYYLRVCADKKSSLDSGVISEYEEDNNCGPWTSINIFSPNLTVTNSTPTKGVIDVPQTYTATVINDGNVSTNDIFQYFIQTASLSQGGGTITDHPSSWTSALDYDEYNNSRILSFSHTFTSIGTKSMRFCVDKASRGDEGEIIETNEGDNCGDWVDINISGVMSGTLEAQNPPGCIIDSTDDSCNVSLDWSILYPETIPTKITSDGILDRTVSNSLDSSQSGTETFTISHGDRTFYLYNNGGVKPALDELIVTAECDEANGYIWDTTVGTCVVKTYTVSTYVDGLGGTISPVGPLTVDHLNNAVFTITPIIIAPDNTVRYVIDSVTGCSGTLVGNTYTTGPITSACTVTAKFREMTGYLTIDPLSCKIILGDSSCFVDLNWGITDPIGNTTAITYTNNEGVIEEKKVSTSITPQSQSGIATELPVPYGGRDFYLYNNSILLNPPYTRIDAQCDPDTSVWNGTICAPSAGTLRAEYNPIPANGNTCSIGLYWNTTHPIVVSEVTTPEKVLVGSGNDGFGHYDMNCSSFADINDCNRNFFLYNGGEPPLDIEEVNCRCDTSYRWDEETRKCVYQPPILDLVTPGCTIALGASTCNSTITWDTLYPITGQESVLKSYFGATLAIGNSNISAGYPSGYSKAITYGENGFTLTHIPMTVTGTAIASCVGGTHWENGVCTIDIPSQSNTWIKATPNTVIKGKSSLLEWNSNVASTCVLKNSDNVILSSGPVSGTKTTGPLEKTMTYTLTCTNTSGSSNQSVEVKVISLDIKEN